MKLFILFLSAVIFCACGTSIYYVEINGLEGHETEISFLESIFHQFDDINIRLIKDVEPYRKTPIPSIFIDVLSSWEYENEYGDILISRNFFAPKEDPLAGRTNTTLAACLDGIEKITQIEEIQPPFVALKVDGLAVGDDAYPLVRATGIRIRTAEERKKDVKLEEKTCLLEDSLKTAHKTLIRAIPKPLWISAGGDVMLERGATEILLKEGPKGIFGKTAEMLASSDISLLNLEGVISRSGEREKKSFTFRFIPEVAPALRAAGINVVLHANNHIFDFGETAFKDSLAHLAQAGIAAVGAGLNIEEASSPFVFKRDDIVCRVFGLASFPRERNGWDGVTAATGQDRPGMLHVGRQGKEKLIEKLAESKSDVINVILFHGGEEWSTAPDVATRRLYTELVAAGADLVIGTHPHIVQGFEWIDGKAVFWSLGNYVFAGMQETGGGDEGLFLRLGFLDGRLLYMEPFALALNQARTDIAPKEKLATFYSRSKQLRQ